MKFRVRKDLEMGKVYGDKFFSRWMDNIKGKEISINGAYHNATDVFLIDGFDVSFEMLEPVEETDKPDLVNHPAHYADRKYEVIDIIKDSMSSERFKGFLQANIIKYVLRYQKKGGVQDLEKAEFYLKRLIAEESEVDNG